MTQFSNQTAAGLAQFINYAYDMEDTPVGTIPATPLGFPPNYTIVAYAQAQDDFWGDDNPEYYGFVAQSTAANQIIVAIRGTDPERIIEWLIDFEVDSTPFIVIPQAGSVEEGFYSVFSTMTFIDPDMKPFNLQNFLVNAVHSDPNTAIIIEGHSLGGPIVAMLALQLAYQTPVLKGRTTVYTFAAPAPGDQTFANFYDANAPQTFRVWNVLDPVPPALDLFDYYQIAGDGIGLYPTWDQLEGYDFLLLICNHSLMTYQWLLDNQYPLASICQWPSLAASPDHLSQLQRTVAAVRRRQAKVAGA